MSRVKYFLPLLVFLLFASCENAPPENENGAAGITSPRVGWNYYEDRVIQLSMNVRSSEIDWHSDTDGFLGTGNGLFVTLGRGTHSIEARHNGNAYTVEIEVKRETVGYLEERRYLVNRPELKINMTEGTWYPAVASYDGTAISFSYSVPEPKPSARSFFAADETRLRDFHVPVDNLPYLNTLPKKESISIARYSYSVGAQKTFNVLNTKEPLGKSQQVLAEMIYSGSKYTIWKNYFESIDTAALYQCISNIDNIIMPRLLAIWGEWADVDGDGKVAILFSDTINRENVATGFFYPKDMFVFRDDPDDPSFNPDSNETDMVYVAYPVTGDPSYNPRSVSATIAHEITHLITFSRKTYNKLQTGNGEIKRETVFLEEGWSHLSENLCGFGTSGGNIMFLKRYLDNMPDYSFCGPNRAGEIDSVGMRGAVTLFMSWLFWKKGGMDWHETDPGAVYDRGGIAFLQRLVSSDHIGWPGIGQADGRTIDDIFTEFVHDMNRQRIVAGGNFKTDPHTGEPAEFLMDMGTVSYNGVPYNVKAGAALPPDTPRHTLPWSLIFLEPTVTQDGYQLPVSTTLTVGKVFLSLLKGG